MTCTPENLSSYAPADALAKRARLIDARRMLVEMYENFCDLTYEDRQEIKLQIRALQAEVEQ